MEENTQATNTSSTSLNTNTNGPKLKIDNAKDKIALVLSAFFVLVLVFTAYKYFNVSELKTLDDDGEVTLSTSTVRDADGNEKTVPTGQITDGTNSSGQENNVGTTKGGVITNAGTQASSAAVWIANDYKAGDISKGSYTVVSGDTLWEIAEAVYGNGTQWTTILQANAGDIGFLPNGSQALIVPGQVLVIP